MKAGETKRFECADCLKEFEVTLEPKAAEMTAQARAKLFPEDHQLKHCPFCGSAEIEDLGI